MMVSRRAFTMMVSVLRFLGSVVVAGSILLWPATLMAQGSGHQHEMGGHSMERGHMAHSMGEHGKADVPAAFREALAPLYREYFGLHKALVGGDLAGARSAFAKVGQAISAIDMALLEGKAHEAWMQQAPAVKRAADAGAQASDLSKARERFSDLSASVIAIDKKFGHTSGEKHFVIFCPMALNEKGASWLQASADVRNPYFETEKGMERCGELREELP